MVYLSSGFLKSVVYWPASLSTNNIVTLVETTDVALG